MNSVSVTIGAHGKITKVEADQPAESKRYSILLPAPVNLHSHAFQRAMAGMTETCRPGKQDDFWSWRRHMFAFLEHLSPDDMEAIAAFAQMEMLEAGFAAVAEFHYLHHGKRGAPYDNPAEMSSRIVSAASSSGIGLTLLPALYEHAGCDGRPLTAGQHRFGCSLDQFSRLLEAASSEVAHLPKDSCIGVAAHSLRAVRAGSLEAAAQLMPASPFHMHLAEQQAEVREIESAWGARPVTWLLDHVEVNRRWCLIHCTQMNAPETRALARSGAVAGLCPITEGNLGDGVFHGVGYLRAGGRFGIGSDSNIRIAQTDEYRMLEYCQRLRDGSRAALAVGHASTGRALLEGACSGGAMAAARNSGRIGIGAWADLMELDGNKTDLAGLSGDTILDAWIFAGSDRMIRNVWSAGRHVVQDGRHVRRNKIEDRYRSVQARLRALL